MPVRGAVCQWGHSRDVQNPTLTNHDLPLYAAPHGTNVTDEHFTFIFRQFHIVLLSATPTQSGLASFLTQFLQNCPNRFVSITIGKCSNLLSRFYILRIRQMDALAIIAGAGKIRIEKTVLAKVNAG